MADSSHVATTVDKILVVEDSKTQAEALRSILTDAGYATAVAHSGKAAVGALEGPHGDVQLVISDIVMPGMDGFALCEEIRRDTRTAELPVILLTSLRDPLDVVRALEAGADSFLTKPYDADQLLARVATILANRREQTVGRMQMALNLSFLGRRFVITAERQQVLDLLLSTFEDLVRMNRQLRAREGELADAQEHLAAQLRQADFERQRLSGLLASMPDAVLIADPDGRVSDTNPAADQLLSVGRGDLLGLPLRQAAPLTDESGQPVDPHVVGSSNMEPRLIWGARLTNREGARIPVSVHTVAVDGAAGEAITISVLRDVSATAFHDPVTGLANRTLLLDRVDRALRFGGRRQETVAVVFLDLDGFSRINDSLGRPVGDRILFETARRIEAHTEPEETVSRVSGDEFAVLLEKAGDGDRVTGLAQTLVDSLQEPFDLDGQAVALACSAGVALSTGASDAAEDLLARASLAMDRVRGAGGHGWEVYDPEVHARARARLKLESDLRRAIVNDEFVVHYQPVLAMDARRLVEFEALVRWEHPDRGLVPPGEFITVAEQTGDIDAIGLWVLEEACRQLRSWQDEHHAANSVSVAVNISARQLDATFAPKVAEVLARTKLDPANLVLEVTESTAMADVDMTVAVLRQLKALGLRISIDDFGTGYSSLSHLTLLPLDTLKIDRSFVRDLATTKRARDVVEAILSLARALQLPVIAEGVETDEQADVLRRMGCDFAAGYLFSPPIPAAEAADLIPRAAAH